MVMQLVALEVTSGDGGHLQGLVPLDDVLVVVGKNNSGKTTLLEVLERDLSDEWSAETRSQFRMHRGTGIQPVWELPDPLPPAILESPHPTEGYDTLESFLESFSTNNTTMVDRLAAAVYWAAKDGWDYVQEPPPIDDLKALARQGLLTMWQNGDELEVRFAGADPDIPPLGVVPRHQRGALVESRLPRALPAPAELESLDHLAERVLDEVAGRWFGDASRPDWVDVTDVEPSDPWIEPEQPGRLAAGLRDVVTAVEDEVTRLLPPFASPSGEFSIVIQPDSWGRTRSRCTVGFADGDSFIRATALGSGTRRWLGVCLALARENLASWYWPTAEQASIPVRVQWRRKGRPGGLVQDDRRPPILLVDEVELHLHPDAQREIAAWLEDRRLDGDVHGAIVTTHSGTFLGAVSANTRFAALRRQGEVTSIEVLEDVLSSFDASATLDGLGREAWFFATQAVLVVEGEHDLRVIKRFFGPELDRARIRVLPLRGTSNSKRLIDSEFLGRTGLPQYVLFDNLSLDRVRGEAKGGSLTDEERIARSLLLQSDHQDITFLTYTEPDILCAIPMEAVAKRYPHLRLEIDSVADETGHWTRLVEQWREQVEKVDRVSFKKWVAKDVFELKPSTNIVEESLPRVSESGQPSPGLRSAIQELLAAVEPTLG